MAYANAHVKITLFGSSWNGAEEWSTGFRMGGEDPGGANFGVPEGFPETVAAAWATFFTKPQHLIPSSWKTNGVKCAVILPDGKTDLSNVVTYSYPTPVAGSGSSTGYPSQISLVAQLAAASPVGLGSKGRMYLPGINCLVGSSGKISSSDAALVAGNLRDFLDACESAGNSPGYVINASKGRPGVPFTPPVNRRVVSVRVGDVYDTQRRRRNGLKETYSGAALAA